MNPSENIPYNNVDGDAGIMMMMIIKSFVMRRMGRYKQDDETNGGYEDERLVIQYYLCYYPCTLYDYKSRFKMGSRSLKYYDEEL